MSSEKKASTRKPPQGHKLSKAQIAYLKKKQEADAALEALIQASHLSTEEELTEEGFVEAVLEGGLRYLDTINDRLDALNANLEAHLRQADAAPTVVL